MEFKILVVTKGLLWHSAMLFAGSDISNHFSLSHNLWQGGYAPSYFYYIRLSHRTQNVCFLCWGTCSIEQQQDVDGPDSASLL